MIEYRCPHDGALFFKAEAPIQTPVEVKCRRCKRKVRPVAEQGEVWHRTYRCTECERTQHVENPGRERRAYCIVCGTKSLEVVDEVRPRADTPEPEKAWVPR